MTEYDLTPELHLLVSQNAQSLGWTKALGELIDNSFDAQAKQITIEFGPRQEVKIKDDGKGCERLVNLIKLGARGRNESGLGRYGIGAKDVFLWLWGETHITTVYKGTVQQVVVDWAKLQKSDSWKWNGDEPREATPDLLTAIGLSGSGTLIRCAKFTHTIPDSKEKINNLREAIGYLFFPALSDGKQIILKAKLAGSKAEPITPFRPPPLERTIDADINVGGRSAHVYAGIVKEGVPNPRSGFSYTHLHRVIKPATSLGAGEYSTRRIWGMVKLDRTWKLSKNKDDIHEHIDELGDAVFHCCESILKEASEQESYIESEHIAMQLTDALRGVIASQKEKRKKGNKKGTIEPKNTERKRTNATETQDGGEIPAKVRAIRIEWLDGKPEIIGNVDLDGKRINLSRDHECIREMIRKKDYGALLVTAISLLSHQLAEIEPHRRHSLMPKIDIEESTTKFCDLMSVLITPALLAKIVPLPKIADQA